MRCHRHESALAGGPTAQARRVRTAVDDIVANSGRAGMNNVVTPSASFIAASSYSRKQSVEFRTPRMITPHPFPWQ